MRHTAQAPKLSPARPTTTQYIYMPRITAPTGRSGSATPPGPIFSLDDSPPMSPSVHVTLNFHPSGEDIGEMSLIMFPPEAVTLRNPDILDNNFFASPAQYTICLKPHLSHQAIPGVSFTVIVFCPHHTDVAQSPPGPNRAVANLLPDQCKHEMCNGNLMVFKHAISNNPAVSNQDLPVVDVLPADFLHVDELMGLRSVAFRINQIKSDLDKTPGYLQEGLTRCYSISMVALNAPLPLYDLDEIIASLILDDPPTSRTPPPSYRSHLPPSSPASSPPRTPHTPSRNAPSTATIYTYCSPGKSGVSNAWSEAGHATQGVSHSSVHAVAKSNPRRPKSKAYVVFRGLRVGVFEKWDNVVNATSGVSCALQQGYTSCAAAQAAYALAQANDWTCVFPTTRSSFAAPTGLTREPRDSELLCPRERNDRWYIVYCGVHPGVFATHVECQLNVLGVQAAVYDRTESSATHKRGSAWRVCMPKTTTVPPEVLQARLDAHQEAAHKYREKNRRLLASKARKTRKQARKLKDDQRAKAEMHAMADSSTVSASE
ncbi:hypothetical protein B0H14DRAFT_3521806 [Mycena olivaceomarginata]|nr:hypothetical protein B0H14DRAFT_3521806 [Mycena olivaceomarginata]